jgi:hypothetical protein
VHDKTLPQILFAMLSAGRPTGDVCRLVQAACRAALDPLSR